MGLIWFLCILPILWWLLGTCSDLTKWIWGSLFFFFFFLLRKVWLMLVRIWKYTCDLVVTRCAPCFTWMLGFVGILSFSEQSDRSRCLPKFGILLGLQNFIKLDDFGKFWEYLRTGWPDYIRIAYVRWALMVWKSVFIRLCWLLGWLLILLKFWNIREQSDRSCWLLKFGICKILESLNDFVRILKIFADGVTGFCTRCIRAFDF